MDQILKRPFFEQIGLQHSEDLLHRALRFRLKFHVRNEQVDTQSDPDLRHHCVFAGAYEGLDFQVLLYPLEEQFDLSALFIDARNQYWLPVQSCLLEKRNAYP